MHVGIVKTIHPISYNKLLLFCKKKKKLLKIFEAIFKGFNLNNPLVCFCYQVLSWFSKFFLAQKSLWTFKITHPAATSRNFALDFLTFHDSGVRKVKCQLWCDYVVGDVKNFYQSNDIKINNWKM